MENYQRNFVLNLLAYAVQREVDIHELCKRSGIDLNELKKFEKTAFSNKQWNDLWHQAVLITNDALFGLHFGESLQLAALGVVGEIIKTSSTVGDALTQAAALSHVITDLFYIKATVGESDFTITFQVADKAAVQQNIALLQMLDFFMVFTIHELNGLLLAKIKPQKVYSGHEITNYKEYERVLRCTHIVKRAKTYTLFFDKRYWDEPIITADYAIQSELLKKVAATKKKEDNVHTLGVRIYNYLLANSYLGTVPLEEVAANFNVSPRTLQRKLKEEGIKYQQLADEVKMTLAQYYLKQGNYQVKEISAMLGYNELSAFTKAFKRWTGTSPSYYQTI
jgi:AraC-like DNA-binding protein